MGVLKTNYFMPTCELIKERLEIYKITQKELAKRLNVTEKHVSKLLNNEVILTIEMAIALENVLNLNHEILMNYEIKYRSFIEKNKIIEQLEKENLDEIQKKYQMNFLIKKGWINVRCGASLGEKVYELLSFFGVSKIESINEVYYPKISSSAFKEDGYKIEPLLVWMKKCEINSREQVVKSFDKNLFKEKINEISKLMIETDIKIFDRIKEICNECGIYFVMEEAVPNSKVRGAITWIGNNPVIQISLRYSTVDHFWFAFFHEVGHILLHTKKNQNMIDYDKLDLNKNIEKEADDFAQNIIIKKEKYDEFVNLMNYSKLSIIEFSKENKIHPAILLGRLQHDKIIGWNCYNELKPRYKWTESL